MQFLVADPAGLPAVCSRCSLAIRLCDFRAGLPEGIILCTLPSEAFASPATRFLGEKVVGFPARSVWPPNALQFEKSTLLVATPARSALPPLLPLPGYRVVRGQRHWKIAVPDSHSRSRLPSGTWVPKGGWLHRERLFQIPFGKLGKRDPGARGESWSALSSRAKWCGPRVGRRGERPFQVPLGKRDLLCPLETR